MIIELALAASLAQADPIPTCSANPDPASVTRYVETPCAIVDNGSVTIVQDGSESRSPAPSESESGTTDGGPSDFTAACVFIGLIVALVFACWVSWMD